MLNSMSSVWHGQAVWLLFLLVSVGCAIFNWNFVHLAFPVVHLDLKIDAAQAKQAAMQLHQQRGWRPQADPVGFQADSARIQADPASSQADSVLPVHQVAVFESETEIQHFVELEDGNQAFAAFLESEQYYHPFYWRLRHFKEGEAAEVHVMLTERGTPYGFVQILPEHEAGAVIDPERARSIAEEQAAMEPWLIDFSKYTLVEQSQQAQFGGRTDHSLTYERMNISIGHHGTVRLRIEIAGESMSQLMHFVKVPESFHQRHEELTSYNSVIAFVSSIFMIMTYGVGGCAAVFFFYQQEGWIAWKPPFLAALIVGFSQVLLSLNEVPTMWIGFDTALDSSTFLLQYFLNMALSLLKNVILLFGCFLLADSLTRRAFPQHINIWKVWSLDAASSTSLLGRTVAAYFLVNLTFTYDIIMYTFTRKYLNWWIPSSILFEPNVLSNYFPWFGSIANSLMAGVLEECLFRAIPLAGAALIGEKFNVRKIGLTVGMIVQSIVFASAHANYPNQPYYARVVELILPSVLFGGLYIRFGLLTPIILHYAFDVIWLSLPLFISRTPAIWIQQTLVILISFIPLWVVLLARIRKGSFISLDSSRFYNYAFKNPPQKVHVPQKPTKRHHQIGNATRRAILVLGLLCLGYQWSSMDKINHAPPLSVTRNEAITAALDAVGHEGFVSNASVLAHVEGTHISEDDVFIWKVGHYHNYTYFMKGSGPFHLAPPHWVIRICKFSGELSEKAEEWYISFKNTKERTFQIIHKVPESMPGKSLSGDQAKDLAVEVLLRKYPADAAAQMVIVSAEQHKRPHRMDWLITFKYNSTRYYPLGVGEVRVEVGIAGEEITDLHEHFFIPEEWQRSERKARASLDLVSSLCQTMILIINVFAVGLAVFSWTHNLFHIIWMRILMTVHGVILLAQFCLDWPSKEFYFSTAISYSQQAMTAIGLSFIGSILFSILPSLVLTHLFHLKKEQRTFSSFPRIRSEVFLGLSLGFMLSTLLLVIERMTPRYLPVWSSNYSAASSLVPSLSIGLDALASYTHFTTGALFLFTMLEHFTDGWKQRRFMASLAVIATGLILTGSHIESIVAWLTKGVSVSLFFLVVYIFILRYHLELVPLMVEGNILLRLGRTIRLHALPASALGGILGIVLTLLCAVLCWLQLHSFTIPHKTHSKQD